MTSNELATTQGTFNIDLIPDFQRYADHICKTDFVPAGMKNNGPAVLACIMTGQELGIPPMQSLRQIYNFDGKIGLFSELMRALVLRDGHRIWFGKDAEYSTTRVVCYGERSDSGDTARVEWTWDMAQKAGLTNKNNWKTAPRAMLSARASTEVCRTLFPDVIAGLPPAEELQDGVGTVDDSITVDAEVVQELKTTTTRTAPAPRKRTAAPKEKAQPAATTAAPRPPLPGEAPIDVEVVDDEPEQTPAQKARSVAIVRLAHALKIDHHPVVSAVTKGETESARLLDEETAASVMSTLRDIDAGRAEVADRGDGQMAIYATEDGGTDNPVAANVEAAQQERPPLPSESTQTTNTRPSQDVASTSEADSSATSPDDEPLDVEVVEDDDDPEDWDIDKWRAYLADHNVKVTVLLRHAAKTTAQDKIPIGNLAAISGSGKARELKAYVDSQQP